MPVKSTEEGELDDEAEWIYRHAFLEMPISQQQVWLIIKIAEYIDYNYIVTSKSNSYKCIAKQLNSSNGLGSQ